MSFEKFQDYLGASILFGHPHSRTWAVGAASIYDWNIPVFVAEEKVNLAKCALGSKASTWKWHMFLLTGESLCGQTSFQVFVGLNPTQWD